VNDEPGSLTLIGYRGCGKSTVAPLVAERIGWNWIDTDDEIERRTGRSIKDIFALEGESAFRALERDVIAGILQTPGQVIASGGGAVTNPDTRRDMLAAGEVVYLSAPIDLLAKRIQGDVSSTDRRPNLTAEGGRAEVVRMMALREPLYRQTATLVIDVDELSPGQIADRIEMYLGKRRPGWIGS